MVKRPDVLNEFFPHDCLEKDEPCKICHFKRTNVWLYTYFGKSLIPIKLLLLKMYKFIFVHFMYNNCCKVKEFENRKKSSILTSIKTFLNMEMQADTAGGHKWTSIATLLSLN